MTVVECLTTDAIRTVSLNVVTVSPMVVKTVMMEIASTAMDVVMNVV